MAGAQAAPSCFDAKPDCEPSDGGPTRILRSVLSDRLRRLPREVLGEHQLGAHVQQVTSTRLKRDPRGLHDQQQRGCDAQSDDCAPGLVCLDEGAQRALLSVLPHG